MQALEQRARRKRRAEQRDGIHVIGLRRTARSALSRNSATRQARARRASSRAARAPSRAAGAGARGCCPGRRRHASASTFIRRRRARAVAVVGATLAAARAPALLRRFVGFQHGFARRRPMLPGSASTSRRGPAAPRRSRRAARGNRRRRETADARAVAPDAVPDALLEARLQRPDLLDRRLEAARDRDALRLRVAAPCPSRRTAPACGRSPRSLAAFHVASTSCHSSVANRNAGRHGLVGAHARIGTGERGVDEACARAAARGSRRAAAAGHATARVREGCAASRRRDRTEAASASRRTGAPGARWPSAARARRSAPAVFGSIARPSFAASRTARSMRTGSSR